MNDSGNFAVCVYDLPIERDDLLDVLIDHFGYHRTDARIRIRNLPGILPDRFAQARALQLVDEIQEAGGHAMVVADDEIPDLKHAPLLHHVRCAEQGFVIVGSSGAIEEVVPWSTLVGLAIGKVHNSISDHGARPVVFNSHTDGLPAVGATPERHHVIHELWLATESPARYFRFKEHEVNFEYLDERKTTSGTTNFKLFVQDIVRHAPQIAYTAAVKSYLDGELRQQDEYSSPEAFHNYVAGQMVVIRTVRRRELEG